MILRKFCPEDAPYGVSKYQETPAPLSYVSTKSNHHTTDQEIKYLQETYANLHYASVVCTLLYLALGTRSDITWVVMKLSKSCIDPGTEDYKALLHLLGYLCKKQYYTHVQESPVAEIWRWK